MCNHTNPDDPELKAIKEGYIKSFELLFRKYYQGLCT